jgi:nucleoid DNA-binding protein/ABC-type dipeptide/oligopeptide/nickel transport system ATPase subunit
MTANVADPPVRTQRDVLQEAYQSKPNVHNLSEDDVSNIWGYISEYIKKQLQNEKGVHIAGLGTFTFTHKKVVTGKKSQEINRPVFVVSEKFVMTHGLPQQKIFQTSEVPVVPLNFAAIAFESPYHRDIIESCTKDVLLSLSRNVANNRNVEFVFSGLGRLTMRERKVKMRFFKEFINTLDDGDSILKSMANRPFTADSVMSDRPMTGRPESAMTLILPSVAISRKQPDVKQPLPAIAEDAEASPRTDQHRPDAGQVAGAVQEPASNHLTAAQTARDHVTFESPKPPLSPQPTKPASASMPALQRSNTLPSLKPAYLDTSRPESECGHRQNTGQHICYVCHQRDARNQPVNFERERQRRVEEEDRLLAQYQHLRDTEAILKEQEKMADGRELQQHIAAFNLGVADAVKDEKARKAQFHPSFVLPKRPHTPHRFFEQAKYYEELNNQSELKAERARKERQDKQFLEKLEQIQLAEDLTAQRDAHLREKEQQRTALQRALDTQLKYLPEQIPKAVSDSIDPIFGLHDGSGNDKLQERADRNAQVKMDLVLAAREKKKHAILNDLLNQKEEEEMLTQVKRELKEDYVNRHNRNFNQRRSLEDDWLRSMVVKQQKDEDDHKHRMHPPGSLLDQAHVARCGQCQRNLPNRGKTNLWKESHYVPGSRLIL